VDRFCWMSSLVASAHLKCDVNQGSWSLIIFLGIPNYCTMWSKYSWAIPGPVIIVVQERKRVARKHPWSTIVRIVSCPRRSGRPVIKSIDTLWNGSVPGLEGIWNVSTFF
jgi:hypothetical protein